MNELRAFGRAQQQRVAEFRESEEAQLLSRLAQTECLLDLAKLPGLRVDLATYAKLVVGIVSQFIPTRFCSLELIVEDLPPISSSYGTAPKELSEVTARQLLLDEEPVGTLVLVAEVEGLAPSEFFDRIAEQVSSSLTSLVEAEQLRRQAAVAQTIHFIEALSGSPTTEDLEALVNALAALPNAVGARLELAHSVIGGSVSLEAGTPPVVKPTVLVVPGGSVGLAIHWAVPNQPGDDESVAEVLSLIELALSRAEERQQLRDQAETDPLTGVGNRRRAMRALASAIALAEQTDDCVGVIYFDLDFFKRVNDSCGHETGDKVLFNFATHLQNSVRSYDSVSRIGGEEFLLICPGLDEPRGEMLAQRIIESTPEACAAALPEDWHQTASAGVACYPRGAQHSEDLIQAADQALYSAKKGGRNRVQLASRMTSRRAS
jgi:diguanylate cyclase (GGDEF)-like protein